MSASARIIGNFVDGDYTTPDSAELIDRHAPGTDEVVSQVVASSPEAVDAAIDAARVAFDSGPWPRTTGMERAIILNRLADLIDRDAAELARLDSE